MLSVNGFYGHVRRNEMRALCIFAGFLIAFQIVAAAALALPLAFFDLFHFPFLYPLSYLGKYGAPILIIELLVFLGQFLLFTSMVQTSIHFRFISSIDHCRLHKIVQNLSITAGIKTPRIAMIDSEQCNAFACGTDYDNAVIVVTRGLLEILDDEELATVMAHEIVHIRDGDIVLMACANIMVSNISLLSRFRIIKMFHKGCLIAMLIFPLFLYFIFFQEGAMKIGDNIGRFCRSFVGKSREFVADAEAVRLTHNPAALISALRKIQGRSDVETAQDMIESMMIDGHSDGPDATHPTIEERIAAITKLSGSMALDPRQRRDNRPIEDVKKHRIVGFGKRGL
ncbi:MAG: M48 family metalloprotease [Sphingomonadales bacterium]|nr:M48 family metalloprotease [Sphingomonadales bacterium]